MHLRRRHEAALPPSLAALEGLILYGNRLASLLPSLRGMAALQRVFLNHNAFDAIPADFFAGLIGLLKISLSNNPLSASAGGWALPPDLAASAQLQILALDNCTLTGAIPDFLGAMTSLQRLSLTYNRLSGLWPHPRHLQRLWPAELVGVGQRLADVAQHDEVPQVRGRAGPEDERCRRDEGDGDGDSGVHAVGAMHCSGTCSVLTLDLETQPACISTSFPEIIRIRANRQPGPVTTALFYHSLCTAAAKILISVMEGSNCSSFSSSSSGKRIAVVTGGNKGIGLEVCRQLAFKGVMVILTARDEKRGAEAVDLLHGSGLSDVKFRRLDVSDPSSATNLAEFIKEEFGRLDILINNAGVIGATAEIDTTTPLQDVLVGKSPTERLQWLLQHSTESYEEAEECLKINYLGTKYVTETLLPLLQSSCDGRLINVSSNYGLLRYFSGEDLKQELNDIDNLTVERLDEMSELFLKDYKNGDLKSHGWPADSEYLAYKVSKALINGYTRILAKKYPVLHINSVHPGYCKTDINFDTGEFTADEGARCIVAVALLPEGGPTGVFFFRTEEASFV
ncbi:hypothetical protein ACP4OV_004576 [Aristida adscensionis]